MNSNQKNRIMKEELEALFDDLEKNAIDNAVFPRTYFVKEANQIIRKHFESLYEKRSYTANDDNYIGHWLSDGIGQLFYVRDERNGELYFKSGSMLKYSSMTASIRKKTYENIATQEEIETALRRHIDHKKNRQGYTHFKDSTGVSRLIGDVEYRSEVHSRTWGDETNAILSEEDGIIIYADQHGWAEFVTEY